MMPYHAGWGPFFGDGLLALLILIALVVLVTWAVIALVGGRRPGGRGIDEAEQILRARLARGEISSEEYERTRQVLGLK
jgi:putative membrane protein